MDSHIFEWFEHENKRIFITEKETVPIAHAVYRFGIEEVVRIYSGEQYLKARNDPEFTNTQQLVAIKSWQNLGFVHELTCGDDTHLDQGARPVLEGIEKDGKVFLICPKCGYLQERVPYMVFAMYLVNRR